MKNFTKKKIFLGIILSFLSGLSAFIFTNYQGNLKANIQPISETPISSNLEEWKYRREISIIPSTPEADYQIKVEIVDSITVKTPDALTTWEKGTNQTITWTSVGSISNVKIELYKTPRVVIKGGLYRNFTYLMDIVASTINDGSYIWAIPEDLEDRIDYLIRIIDVSNPITYHDSPNFVIASAEIPGGGDGAIPGYHLYILIGIISVISIILIKRRFNLTK